VRGMGSYPSFLLDILIRSSPTCLSKNKMLLHELIQATQSISSVLLMLHGMGVQQPVFTKEHHL
jgi:hypothetical protein